jgi:hypothetical protein
MLQASRFAPHFSFFGDFNRHFGLFPGCGSTLPFTGVAAPIPMDAGKTSGSCC